jgi:hypothetical protein
MGDHWHEGEERSQLDVRIGKANTTHMIVLFEEWCCNKEVGTFLDLAGSA